MAENNTNEFHFQQTAEVIQQRLNQVPVNMQAIEQEAANRQEADTQEATTREQAIQHEAAVRQAADEHLQSEIDLKQNALTFDNEPRQNSDNPVKSGGIKTAIDQMGATKQDTLTFDDHPTAGSSHPVTSGGVKSAIDAEEQRARLVEESLASSKQNVLHFDNVPTADSLNPVTSGGIALAIRDFITKSVNDLANYYLKSETDTLLAQKQAVITDGAQIGLGFGVCDTAADTAAKVVAIPSFILLKNMPVSIRFTNAINVDSATLNISSTGAKPLFIQGAALQGGLVKGGCTVTVIYDGTNWNIVGIEGLERPASQSDLFVDMGLPSGRLWAIANIDVTKQSGFAEVDGKPSPFIYECTFFSWGNTEGHNPTSTSAFSYDWGTGNDGPYAQTPGAQLTANAGLSFDAARAILGAPWRDPSTEDFAELFANIDFVQADGETVIDASQANKLVTVNGIVGIYLKSKINGRLIFFPCSGYGYGQSWNSRGSSGHYWSRGLGSQTSGRGLLFYSGGVSPRSDYGRFYGFSRRAVQ